MVTMSHVLFPKCGELSVEKLEIVCTPCWGDPNGFSENYISPQAFMQCLMHGVMCDSMPSCSDRQTRRTPGYSIRKVTYTSICIAHFTQSASNALRHGSHSFTCKLHHACLYTPAAEHHRPLTGTHFTVPRRVEGCVDLGGWLHTGIKCRLRESNGHPSQY